MPVKPLHSGEDEAVGSLVNTASVSYNRKTLSQTRTRAAGGEAQCSAGSACPD